MTNFDIKQAANKEIIDAFFLVVSVTQEQTKTDNPKPFLNIVLANKHNEINCKLWDNSADDFDFFSTNSIIKVRAEVNEYRGNKQLIIKKYREEYGLNISEFIPTTHIHIEDEYNHILSVINDFENDTLRTICKMLIIDNASDIKKIGAAKVHHHSIVGGWLEHTSTMLKNGIALITSYNNNINKELLLAGIILHDIGKLREFKYNQYGVIEDYTMQGELLGHITIGVSMITECMIRLRYETRKQFDENIVILLQHLLLTHHGQPEYGSPKYPMTKEAELLSYLDMLDTKMNMFDKVISETNENEFSQRQWALDNRKIYKL